jgi:hypothetical protein
VGSAARRAVIQASGEQTGKDAKIVPNPFKPVDVHEEAAKLILMEK